MGMDDENRVVVEVEDDESGKVERMTKKTGL